MRRAKLILIGGLIISITILQYFTRVDAHRHHILYQGLYFLPIIMAGFWFGLRVALGVSVSIIPLYLPFVFLAWKSFSGYDFNNLMDLVLYLAAAALIGYLRDREWAEERRAREVERLAAMGKALSGLAHDLKTPLIAIGGLGRFMQKKMAPEDSLQEKMRLIVEESGRLEKMMGDILDFARPLTLNLARGDIRETIARTLSIAETLAERKHIKLLMQPRRDLVMFSFDKLRLEQGLLNLVKNAIEASPEGETVWISPYSKGPNLMIEVTDCGNGIPSHKREEIFEPFITTKDGGTGLGLPIARKIIESHRGHIEIIHNPKGTTFKVVIPMHYTSQISWSNLHPCL